MLNEGVVSPAYGRDYHSKREAELDFRNGADFVLESILPSKGGTYCSIRDFRSGAQVEIRYARKTKLTLVKV